MRSTAFRASGLLILGTALALSACGGATASEQGEQATARTQEPRFPPTNRPEVRGVSGAVSAGHPLAAAAGYDVLRRGGNATDAVVAMAGVLAVVRPHMNGIGGDAFGLFYDGSSGRVTALNGSGRSGALATRDFFLERGHDDVPYSGALTVSVPGAAAAWADALERHGSMSLDQVLAPAIRYARDGFPVTTRLRSDLDGQEDDLNPAGVELYLPDGEPPPAGSLLRNPALASTLERLAREGKHGFYEGPVAERIGAFIEDNGGYLRAGDLAAHTSTWVEPLTGEYVGHTLHVLPPNTQGMAQLSLTGMARTLDLASMGHNSADYLHTLIELKKLAFADRDRWAADPDFAEIPLAELHDSSYLAGRARLVDPERAAEAVLPGIGADAVAGPGPDGDDSGDTVYLTAVDEDGNAVSWIQSLFGTFGSKLLDPETGIVFQNRGALFTLDPDHPNVVEPNKRPYHTLTPLLATRDGELGFTLGTPGGDSQTQSLLQIMNNVFLFGMTPQEAIEAPRFRSYDGLRVAVEDRIPASVRSKLERRGHEPRVVHGWTATFGGAHMILRDPETGALVVAAGPRREGYSIAY